LNAGYALNVDSQVSIECEEILTGEKYSATIQDLIGVFHIDEYDTHVLSLVNKYKDRNVALLNIKSDHYPTRLICEVMLNVDK
jgi:hypothetical protein